MIAVEATNDRSDFAKSIRTRLEFGISEAFNQSSRHLTNEWASTFENKGLKPGFGGRWDRTTFIALTKRRKYPKGLAARKAYHRNFVTLVDTGSYRDSFKTLAFRRKLPIMDMIIGSTQREKARVHEFGAWVQFEGNEGKSWVPPRPVAYLTTRNIDVIESLLFRSLRAITQ